MGAAVDHESALSRELREAYASATAYKAQLEIVLDESRRQQRELVAVGPLAEVLASLGPDERKVLLAVARRLAVGRKCYGPLDIHNDPRAWQKEAGEELLDAVVYLTCDALRRRT